MRATLYRNVVRGFVVSILGFFVFGWLGGWYGAAAWTAFLFGAYFFITRLGDGIANQVHPSKAVFRPGLDRVRALLVDERHEEAVAQIRAMLARAPEDAVVREFLAATLAKMGRPGAARIEYERIFRREGETSLRVRSAHRVADQFLAEEKCAPAATFLREAAALLDRAAPGAAGDLRTRADSIRPG